jgi:hypothetical protein
MDALLSVRGVLALAGVAAVVVAAGFAFPAPSVVRLWPWPDGPLSYLLIASIVGPIGVACLHVAWSGELRAAVAGGIALALGAGGMAAVLIAVGVSLSVKLRNVFPWPLKPETSLLYGCMFLGLFVSYAYAAWRGRWADIQLLLIGVLVYDLILIGPFLRHFARVPPDHLTSLILYTAVLVSTGIVASWYLVARGGWRPGALRAD